MRDWAHWFLAGILTLLWVGWMSVMEARKRKTNGLPPLKFFANCLGWLPGGLLFGFVLEFKAQAFQVPLVFVSLAILGLIIFSPWKLDKERMRPFLYSGGRPAFGWRKTTAFVLLMLGFGSLLVQRHIPPEIGESLVAGAAILFMLDSFKLRRSHKL